MDNHDFSMENKKYVMNTYTSYPIAMEKGQGAYLWDVNGKKYLDFLSGLAVTNFGHAHSSITKAIKKQSKKLLHTSNLFLIPPQIKLAELIASISFPGRTFFCNSGTEANEAAIKFARLRGNNVDQNKHVIVALYDSFHGRTTGSIKLTGQEKYQKGFEPLISGVRYVKRNDISSLEKEFNQDVCAIFVEGIQGESGINPLTSEFVNKTRELCNKNNALFIFDEIQTGIGRTGKYFSYQYFDVTPDIITLAKGLANGLPIGAMHVKEELKDVFSPGNHASTFGGNPFCTTAACEVINLLKAEKTLEHLNEMSNLLFDKLEELKQKAPKIITEIRGKGLMIAIQIPQFAKEVNKKLLNQGIITNAIGENVLRILPPFIIQPQEADIFINTLEKILIK